MPDSLISRRGYLKAVCLGSAVVLPGCSDASADTPRSIDTVSTSGFQSVSAWSDSFGYLSTPVRATLTYDVTIKRSDEGYDDGPPVNLYAYSTAGLPMSGHENISSGNYGALPDSNLHLAEQNIGEGTSGEVDVPAGWIVVVIDNAGESYTGDDVQVDAQFELVSSGSDQQCGDASRSGIKIDELYSLDSSIRYHFRIPHPSAEEYEWELTVQSPDNEISKTSTVKSGKCAAHFVGEVDLAGTDVDTYERLKVIVRTERDGETLEASGWVNDNYQGAGGIPGAQSDSDDGDDTYVTWSGSGGSAGGGSNDGDQSYDEDNDRDNDGQYDE